MSEFSLSALKNALLETKSTPTETEILGTKVYLRRLTAAELIDHEDALIEAQTSGNARMASELSVQIVIDSLVQPDGSPIKAKDKPTAKELLAAHDNVVLLDAIDKVKKHAIGKLETAEKN
ncbi:MULTISPECIES: phage tail protein [Citrobacter]|uniref:phage tail protein n=1 Tax=Citrobacter TaxID=544 RepID=UPI001BCB91F2|nr:MULTISPECIES: phage tail protein [Citrobacter]MDM3176107.1 phage tail protein [Citrobacter sp. Cf112]MDT7065145.1 phage tail protein [Citrobacter freundii]MDT7080201.1 phage tail protein [Citrobacter freundii]MDT7105108.1 phage tail protein [Citrobacter freundii]MDT7111871.1 phage tail protein [Citrobacter freundii]